MITSKSTFGTAVLCMVLGVLAVTSGAINTSQLFLVGGGFLVGLGTGFLLVEILAIGGDLDDPR